MIKNFRTYNLSVKFYQECKKLNLKGVCKNQLNRASLSISLNLAEGYGRFKKDDKNRFYHIAFGSVRECQSLLTVEQLEDTEVFKTLDYLAGSLYCLIRKAS